MPFKKERYPANWKEISNRIRFDRAGSRCEWCGVGHKECGARDRYGKWHLEDDIDWVAEDGEDSIFPRNSKIITIILTVAHLDHDTTNNADENLAALCQKCHLAYDAKHHAVNAAATRAAKKVAADSERGQLTLA